MGKPSQTKTMVFSQKLRHFWVVFHKSHALQIQHVQFFCRIAYTLVKLSCFVWTKKMPPPPKKK